MPSFQRMPVHGFSAPLKFTFHVPAWTPSPASMRSPTISPSKAQVRSLYFSTLSGEHARKTLSPMPLGPTSVPALLLRRQRDASSSFLSLMDAAPAPAKCAMTRSPFFSMLIFRSQPGWSWSA